MIYLVVFSALVFIPTTSTFVDAFRLPQLVYLSVLGVICAWQIRETPLLKPWLFYLGTVALSGLMAPNFGMFLSRFSLDLVGVVLFWYFAKVRNLDTRKIGWVACGTAAGVLLLYSSGWVREVERPAGVIAMAAPLMPGGWIVGLFALGWLRRRAAWLALLMAFTGVQLGRLACLSAALGVLLGYFYLAPHSDLAGRIETWEVGLRVAGENPILGVGRGNLPIPLYSHSPSLPEHKTRWIFGFTDNDYLDLLVEAGPGALVAYLVLLGMILRHRPKTVQQRAIYASLLTVLIRGMSHSVMISPAEVAWFWSLAGLYWREIMPV